MFYFSAATARGHCSPAWDGKYILVLAEVIIGEVTRGCSTFSRPPMNPMTGILYDTTVDNVDAPTIFVKYEKEEYYPEYVIKVQ